MSGSGTTENITVEVVDASGEPVPQAFIGAVTYPGGQQLRRRVDNEEPDTLSDPLLSLFRLARGYSVAPIDGQYWFQTGGSKELTLRRPEGTHVEAVIYAAVPDTAGQLWFDSSYVIDLSVEDEETLRVNRAYIDRWERDSGATVQLWRTVSPQDPTDQTVAAELRMHAPSDRGIVSFNLHEDIPVSYDVLPDMQRTLDPNGRFDRWLNVVAGIEAEYFFGLAEDLEGAPDFYTNADQSGADVFTQYEGWKAPITPKVIDDGPNGVFDYQQSPYEDLDLPEEEIALGLAVVSFFGGGVPAFAASMLGYYITTMEIANEFLIREDRSSTITYDEISDREETLGRFNRQEYDTIPSAWRRTNQDGTWLYAHRVPITQDPDDRTTTRAAFRGAWQVNSSLEATEREFELRSTASPMDEGVAEW
jgi:hypothetical protein